jgi:uncharacterized ferredoxin-like protein
MKREQDIRSEAVEAIAQRMMIAARTAPKGKGEDTIEIAVLAGEEKKDVGEYLIKMVEDGRAADYFARDGRNIIAAQALVLIGTRIAALGVSPCGNCGFKDCAEKKKHPEVPCSFNTTDLGIAIGSAVSVAADCRVDNRVMYTVGVAAKEIGLLGEDVKVVYGIPLSVSSKSPFFDR